jgi:hypothetical protein
MYTLRGTKYRFYKFMFNPGFHLMLCMNIQIVAIAGSSKVAINLLSSMELQMNDLLVCMPTFQDSWSGSLVLQLSNG